MNFLVWDYGGMVELARGLTDNGKNHVWYYIPNSGEDKFKNWAPGLGFENEGLERVADFGKYIDGADYLVFFDKGAGDIAEYFKRTTGKPVYGAAQGENLENNRMLLEKLQKKAGMYYPNRTWIKGIPALRSYLQNKKDKYIKINIFRDDFETTHFTNYDSFKPVLDQLEIDLGPFNEYYDFFVEEPIPGKEPGFDTFFNGSDYPNYYMWGFALENWINIGKFVEKMPEPLQDVADRLKPILTKYDYRGMFGTEVRITEGNKKHVLTDITARASAPVSMAYTRAIKNFPQVVTQVADGKKITIDPRNKYFIMLPLSTPKSKDNWVKLEYDSKYDPVVKSQSSIKVGSHVYATKGDRRSGFIYNLIATGETMEKCISILKMLSEKVDAWGLDKTIVDGLDKIPEFLKDCPKYGLGNF